MLNLNRADLNFKITVMTPRVGKDVGEWALLCSARGTMNWEIFFFFLVTALLGYHLRTIQLTHLKCTVPWFLV